MPHSNKESHRTRRRPVIDKYYRQTAQGKQKLRNAPVRFDDEWYGDADWEDAGTRGKEAGKARQRIELIREERQLQQALRDIFDI
jgi:hypothetical protein